MHNNYYFLRQLSVWLENSLTGTVVSECFSQNKDELIIRFETKQQSVYIKASLVSTFSSLSFPEAFSRARKNSVDLFGRLVGLQVQGVRQFKNERSFALLLSEEHALLFKMHGNRANLILYQGNEIVDLFKHNIPADSTLSLQSLDRTIDWSFEYFAANTTRLPAAYFTLGKVVWKYLSHQFSFETLALEEQWRVLQECRQRLEHPQYHIVEINGAIHLSLLPWENPIHEFKDPATALNEFFYTHTHQFTFTQEKNAALSYVKQKLNSSESYYQKTLAKLREIETDTSYKTWADLLMANMHHLPKGSDVVVLNNFYNHDLPIAIKIKKDLSLLKNAEVFYRKAKNQHQEIRRLQEALLAKEQEIEKLKSYRVQLDEKLDLKSLRSFVDSIGLNASKEKQEQSMPYHEFEYNSYKILVGRSSQHNDILTFRYGYKEDLWLHAKDVPGSHVLIKYQAGKIFPEDVIERAAELAAYNSKRKTESLCPVIVTPKKFVRKRKGDPAGAVIVEREEVIMVVPKL